LGQCCRTTVKLGVETRSPHHLLPLKMGRARERIYHKVPLMPV
jgi:hypothetical protein